MMYQLTDSFGCHLWCFWRPPRSLYQAESTKPQQLQVLNPKGSHLHPSLKTVLG